MKVKWGLLSVFAGLPSFMGYTIPPLDTVTPQLIAVNHEIHKKYNVLGASRQYFEPNLFSIIDDYYYKYHHETIGRSNVKFVSSLLPKIDSVAGYILHANNKIIDYTLKLFLLTF